MLASLRRSAIILSLLLITSPITVLARPNMAPLGPSIADNGSDYYRFKSFKIDSTDQQRHYKIWLAVPKKAPPPQGYSVLYMLDGNSSLHQINEPLLQAISKEHPPVLVFVGYDTQLPFDLQARAFDYTPISQDHTESGYSLGRGRLGGGSQQFRSLLIQKIIPLSEASLPINRDQRSLWGHSYGGLFVLDTYLHAHQFRHYFAASPSLGQGYQSLLNDIAKQQNRSASLTFMLGDSKPSRMANSPPIDLQQQQQIWIKQQLPVTLVNYPGLTHGPMFGASLMNTIKTVSQ